MKSLRNRAGQASIEYLLVIALIVLALSAAPDGSVGRLVNAIGGYFHDFTEGVSRP